jgi:hypothetical protein
VKPHLDLLPVDGRVDLSIMTWKKPLEGIYTNYFFAPNTSYNEGRNMLLAHAYERFYIQFRRLTNSKAKNGRIKTIYTSYFWMMMQLYCVIAASPMGQSQTILLHVK